MEIRLRFYTLPRDGNMEETSWVGRATPTALSIRQTLFLLCCNRCLFCLQAAGREVDVVLPAHRSRALTAVRCRPSAAAGAASCGVGVSPGGCCWPSSSGGAGAPHTSGPCPGRRGPLPPPALAPPAAPPLRARWRCWGARVSQKSCRAAPRCWALRGWWSDLGPRREAPDRRRW